MQRRAGPDVTALSSKAHATVDKAGGGDGAGSGRMPLAGMRGDLPGALQDRAGPPSGRSMGQQEQKHRHGQDRRHGGARPSSARSAAQVSRGATGSSRRCCSSPRRCSHRVTRVSRWANTPACGASATASFQWHGGIPSRTFLLFPPAPFPRGRHPTASSRANRLALKKEHSQGVLSTPPYPHNSGMARRFRTFPYSPRTKTSTSAAATP